MGRYVFKLPDIGEGTAEAEIAAWHVAVGDVVAEEQPLVDLMTEKATVEIGAPVAGRIVSLAGAAGEMRPVGSELVVFEIEGEGAATAPAAKPAAAPSRQPAAPPAEPAPPPSPALAAAVAPPPAERPAAPAGPASAPPGLRPLASPAVRRRATELGADLALVPGSGPAGRISHADLDAHLAGGTVPAAPLSDAVEEVKVIGLRRRIAERMQEAKRRIPHYSYIEEVDVTALEEVRRQLNAAGGRETLTLLPFLMRAMVRALAKYPQINARYDDEAGIVRRHAAVHIGIATQTPNGLVVPVVRHAEALGLWGAAAAVREAAAAAREGRATREALSGSTITITSLGPLGGLATTPVINHPEVAIVGVNKIVARPVVRDGAIVVRQMMNLSSSFDHRVVDGWDAAEFIQDVRARLEAPATLIAD